MAEVFGVFAGGVGVASLAIQLGDSCEKLRKVKATYDDAPAEVESFISEIEQFRRLPEAESPVPGQSDILKECIGRCQKLRIEVHELLHEIHLAIETRQ